MIRFEDAIVDLDSFEKHHPFETFEFLWALVVKHYRDELVSQAAVILGSTDFLGNPLGFVNDVSEGVSLMIYEGSVCYNEYNKKMRLVIYSYFILLLGGCTSQECSSRTV